MLFQSRHLQRFLISAALLLMLVTASLYQALAAGLPNAGTLLAYTSADTTRLYDPQDRPLYETIDPHANTPTPIRLSLDDIPLYLRQATLAIEGANFYDNSGAKPTAILRAVFLNDQASEIAPGSSTLTRQVAQLILLPPEERGQQTLAHELREAILARRLAHTWDKETILEAYLNETCYGERACGVETAARTYFGIQAHDLDLAQCALLAGLPQSPAAYDPLANPEAAKGRQKIVLQAMVSQGYISQFEADLAYTETLRFTSHPDRVNDLSTN